MRRTKARNVTQLTLERYRFEHSGFFSFDHSSVDVCSSTACRLDPDCSRFTSVVGDPCLRGAYFS